MSAQAPPFEQHPQWQCDKAIVHGFFGRRGGVSTGIFESLNCGLGSSDDTADVTENRHRVASALGAHSLLTLHQIHSAKVVEVDAPWIPENTPRADGMVTRTPGIALGILAADCLPVLFIDSDAKIIGACHAGWQGALGGVLEATISAMEKLGARLTNIHAITGPSISQTNYEVGPEYAARFTDTNTEYAQFFTPSTKANHFMFDLPGFAASQLSTRGVKSIRRVEACVYAQANDYFSYRRTTHRKEADYGRNISAILLRD